MVDLMWRNKNSLHITNNKVIGHDDFVKRTNKTLYYGSLPKYQAISGPLADYAAELFSETHKGHSLHRLNHVTVGNLNVTPCSLIMAIIYLDRLNDVNSEYVKSVTPAELFLVSMMVSTKFYSGHDEDIYLDEWADHGNLTVVQMKKLELEFLNAMNWDIYVSNEQFFNKLESIECIIAKRQGLARGWLTYTELIRLLPSIDIAKSILNYSTLIALSYAASVMTIAGAFLLTSNIPGTHLYNSKHSSQLSSNKIDTTTVKPGSFDCCRNKSGKSNKTATINAGATDLLLIDTDSTIEDDLQMIHSTLNESINKRETENQNIHYIDNIYRNAEKDYNFDINIKLEKLLDYFVGNNNNKNLSKYLGFTNGINLHNFLNYDDNRINFYHNNYHDDNDFQENISVNNTLDISLVYTGLQKLIKNEKDLFSNIISMTLFKFL